MRRARIAAAVGAALLVAAVLVVLLRSGSKVAYDNDRVVSIGVVLQPGQEACQGAEFIPHDASKLRVWVSTAGKPGGRLDLIARRGATTVAEGRTLSAYRDSPVYLSVPHLASEVHGADVCVRNRGPIQVAVMGSELPHAYGGLGRLARAQPAAPGPARVDGKPYPFPIRMKLEWHRAGVLSWLDAAPMISRRATQGRPSFVGTWTFWAVMGLVAVTALGGLGVFAREARA